ncbi:hypothetical protein B9Z65_2769 [Elsinoe australis]|uniref:Serine-threonine protein kinase 19-domain-containing protein n=1 Tax=Elsinoe australis TaxID=40998 RepID=A0A2P8A4J3_9PEZI|nr:hypothetical protein B9Z65_2769 [Elsinoe australis]
MSFSATGARRSLQSKPKQNPFLKRSSSSFSNHARTKPGTSEPVAKKVKVQHDNDDDEPLRHGGIVTTLTRPGQPQDVLFLMKYVQDTMFDDIPERSAGMNSTRIAEVLNFRKNLAPIVSLAHLHAISVSPTATDREVAKLISTGVLRRISVPGRGKGHAPLGDGLILTSALTSLVHSSSLPAPLKEKYLTLLSAHPASTTLPESMTDLTPPDISALVSAGFLTSTSALSTSSPFAPSRASAFSLNLSTPVSSALTTAPTGSHDAVGGLNAVHLRGGGAGGLRTTPPSLPRSTSNTGGLTFSIPGTGSYLRLVSEARAWLVALLAKSSPRHREAMRELLRERWDGNMLGEDQVTRAKRARGEWVGVLAGRTKKWKAFYGMRFEWILEEALGSGGVECFDTGTGGLGVRVVG